MTKRTTDADWTFLLPRPQAKRADRTALAQAGMAVGAAAAAACIIGADPKPASAQTFNEAFISNLIQSCDLINGQLIGDETVRASASDATQSLCSNLAAQPGGLGATGAATGASGAVPPPIIQGRLGGGRGLIGEESGGGGQSADMDVDLGGGFSFFVSPGYERLNKSNTEFEDGYAANIVRLTAGADYQVTDWFVAGAALNYNNQDGDFDDGGGFDNDGFGFILFGSFLPFDNAFADLVFGYTRRNFNQTRKPELQIGGVNSKLGTVSSDYSANEVSGSLALGYDYPLGALTVGPRGGLHTVHTDYDEYDEDGNTGVELTYNEESSTSLQSRLGLFASYALSTSFGVVVPQLEGYWVHEYLNDQRNIEAGLKDFAGEGFQYENEDPDRDFGVLGAGVVVVLTDGMQPFASFQTVVGNDQYSSYAVTLGLRFDL